MPAPDVKILNVCGQSTDQQGYSYYTSPQDVRRAPKLLSSPLWMGPTQLYGAAKLLTSRVVAKS